MYDKSIILIAGYPASGKSTHVTQYVKDGHTRLNRDELGGTLDTVARELEKRITAGGTRFVLDNTYHTRKSREPIIALAKKHKIPTKCVVLDTSIEDAQANACTRMVQRYGRLLMPEDISKLSRKDPNIFPPAVLFQYRNTFEPPAMAEGFDHIETAHFQRTWDLKVYKNKAVILDYDGTLRDTRSGAKYPTTREDIVVLPGRSEVLARYERDGYRLLGVSNQSGVAKGELSLEDAMGLLFRTNELLATDIEAACCPHNPAPINCWCRKPMPGLAIQFIEKYKLDRNQTIMVGDRTTDRTFAKRAGIKYADANDFFQ